MNLIPGSGWIDLFAWGTSGYNNKYPYMTSKVVTDYVVSNIGGTYYDWGVYNAIYNPSTNTTDAPGTWRTPTKDEWTYLLKTRATPSGIRYAKATVHGVCGLIIVPDNWNSSIYTLDSANCNNATFESNLVNATHWANLEAAGCVFLPAGGERSGTTFIDNIGSVGIYWSTTYSGSYEAYVMSFSSDFQSTNGDVLISWGFSVRLVKDVR